MANKKNVEKKEEPRSELTIVRDELKRYVDDKIREELVEGIERTNKRVIREKNRTIAVKNFFIIILFCAIVFLLYLLNSVNYFDKYLKKTNVNTPTIQEQETTTTKPVEEVKVPTLDELKDKYSYLLGGIVIDETSLYLEDYYNGDITDSLKKYLALNVIDKEKITNETTYSIITDEALKASYASLFDDDYVGADFDFNGNTIRYIDKLESYISSLTIEHKISNIKREITDIVVNDNVISIATVEGVLLENKLYNVLTKEEVKEYKQDELTKYENKLNKLTYTFKDGKLVSIIK